MRTTPVVGDGNHPRTITSRDTRHHSTSDVLASQWSTMRVLVHDFSGHPFQVQLSRALARHHDVLHVHCPSYATGKGRMTEEPEDSALSLTLRPIHIGSTWDRYSYGRRVAQEVQYGRSFAKVASEFQPDVVLSSNDPLFAKSVSARWCSKNKVPWVFWLQDVYSAAMGAHARQTLKIFGWPFAAAFADLERWLLHSAAHVVSISEDFLPILRRWQIPEHKVTVIENWAPLHEIEPRPRSNPWSESHGLADKQVILYAGTLGLKHNPGLLLEVAERFRHDPSVVVVVASEGLGATWLRQNVSARNLSNMWILPFQPWEQMSDMLASADVLTALLEPEAGAYSVPSKVLTYMCAERAIVAAMPPENSATQLITRVGAGWTCPPGDPQAFADLVVQAFADPNARCRAGRSARSYAETAFDIGTIRSRFETVLAAAVGGTGPTRSSS